MEPLNWTNQATLFEEDLSNTENVCSEMSENDAIDNITVDCSKSIIFSYFVHEKLNQLFGCLR